ncbi:hypothetical protein ACE1SV_69030 [Streptomyces sp. E-15]
MPGRGVTASGPSAPLTASFQNALFSWSGTESVVSTELNWFSLGSGVTGLSGGKQGGWTTPCPDGDGRTASARRDCATRTRQAAGHRDHQEEHRHKWRTAEVPHRSAAAECARNVKDQDGAGALARSTRPRLVTRVGAVASGAEHPAALPAGGPAAPSHRSFPAQEFPCEMTYPLPGSHLSWSA